MGDISKDYAVNKMDKTGVNGYVYDSSVPHNTIYISNVVDIYQYLMKIIIIIIGCKCLDLLKKRLWCL